MGPAVYLRNVATSPTLTSTPARPIGQRCAPAGANWRNVIHRPKKFQTKDQAVAVIFRLFLGSLVIIRLLTSLSTSDWQEAQVGPPPQEVLAKLDALTATLDS